MNDRQNKKSLLGFKMINTLVFSLIETHSVLSLRLLRFRAGTRHNKHDERLQYTPLTHNLITF